MPENKNNVGKGFDRITFFYDAITYITSCNQINKSQLAFIEKLSTQSTGLVVGGGTGYFLQQLLQTNKTIHVTYVDASAKMIAYARNRMLTQLPEALQRVTFVCKPVEELEPGVYDVIVCNYFLDLFDDAHVDTLITSFNRQLSKDALLYVTDFSIPGNCILRLCARVGLKVLYYFFRKITYLPARQLPSIDRLIKRHGFIVTSTKLFLQGILTCTVYKK
ncbi:MAG: class I SAM-dependent methyltransferase [Cytophaga sp.]|uniref:class I SAM-dependent methyltransferase n=1 Tax=Cytophaga sp. TaxID=29535 RepID=UPI003F7D326A